MDVAQNPSMKIAIDITPIKGEQSGHKVRGVGFYLEYLKRSLLEFHPENEYVFFARGEKIDNSVDLVHYPYFEPFFVTLPILEKKKRIITVHDLTPLVFPQHFPTGMKGNISWQMQKYNLKNSARVITDSFASQKDITKIAGVREEKIDIAYLAAAEEFKKIDNQKIKKEVIQKYHLPDEFVLYVGDITWNKNLPRFIRAMKQTKIPVVMVGKALVEKNFDTTNPWNKDLIEVQQLVENDSRFIRLGFIPTEDIVALYNSATVFVLPSVYEGFGLPILEAMQCGCPVVTTKGGSLSEVAGNAAYFVNGYDENDLASGVKNVFSTKSLQESLSKKGLLQAKKFSWQKTADATIAAYQRALSK